MRLEMTVSDMVRQSMGLAVPARGGREGGGGRDWSSNREGASIGGFREKKAGRECRDTSARCKADVESVACPRKRNYACGRMRAEVISDPCLSSLSLKQAPLSG